MCNTDPRELAVGWSRMLRGKWGIATIPISAEAKRPLIYTSEYWSSFPPRPVPLGIVEDFKPRNIAVQTGVASGVVVIDVDDPTACREWFASVPRLPSTWTVKTGGGGLHIYFRLPEWLTAPLYKAILWKGDGKHQEVAFISEQGMAITAPSRFEKRMYKWTAGPNPLRCRRQDGPHDQKPDRFLDPQIIRREDNSLNQKIFSEIQFPLEFHANTKNLSGLCLMAKPPMIQRNAIPASGYGWMLRRAVPANF